MTQAEWNALQPGDLVERIDGGQVWTIESVLAGTVWFINGHYASRPECWRKVETEEAVEPDAQTDETRDVDPDASEDAWRTFCRTVAHAHEVCARMTAERRGATSPEGIFYAIVAHAARRVADTGDGVAYAETMAMASSLYLRLESDNAERDEVQMAMHGIVSGAFSEYARALRGEVSE